MVRVGGLAAMRTAAMAAMAVATLTVLSSASDNKATEPVIQQATHLMSRTSDPTTRLPNAILSVGLISGSVTGALSCVL